jgi:hypothetical protein
VAAADFSGGWWDNSSDTSIRPKKRPNIAAEAVTAAPVPREPRSMRALTNYRSLTFSATVPARKSYDHCADQPVAAKNRRLTRTTEPPILRLA